MGKSQWNPRTEGISDVGGGHWSRSHFFSSSRTGFFKGQLAACCGLEPRRSWGDWTAVGSKDLLRIREWPWVLVSQEAPGCPPCPLPGDVDGPWAFVSMACIRASMYSPQRLSHRPGPGPCDEQRGGKSESVYIARRAPVRWQVSPRPDHVERDENSKLLQAAVEQQEPSHCPRMGTQTRMPQKPQPAQCERVCFLRMLWCQINYL